MSDAHQRRKALRAHPLTAEVSSLRQELALCSETIRRQQAELYRLRDCDRRADDLERALAQSKSEHAGDLGTAEVLFEVLGSVNAQLAQERAIVAALRDQLTQYRADHERVQELDAEVERLRRRLSRKSSEAAEAPKNRKAATLGG